MVLRLSSFPTDVTSTPLTSLSTTSSVAIIATDTVLSAFGKTQGQINLLAPLANPTFTGNVVVPTVAQNNISTTAASTSYVNTKSIINALIFG